MEINSKLKEFFNLEENEEVYQHAITPKSCGGGDEFKLLALLGDRVLNLELYEILTDEGITDSGILTPRLNNYIHNEDILYLVGKILKIDKIMTPMDFTQQITKKDIKESVEALIGANFKAHGFGSHKEIIQKLYEIIRRIESKIKEKKQVQLFYENPKGKVLELFQDNGLILPVFDTQRVGGSDHLPLFKCTLTGTFFDREIKKESDLSNNKKDAEKDVAVKFLMMLEGETDFKTIIKAKEIIVHKKENLPQDFILDEIKFLKMSNLGQPDQINLSSGKGETLYKWAKRKASKDAFRMILLLISRIQNLSSCSWYASLPNNGELILCINSFDGKEYYEIGFGKSKTQAKKDAARKFIENSKLFNWLKDNYGEKLI